MPWLTANINLDVAQTPEDVARALRLMADDLATRKKLPDDECSYIDWDDDRNVGFWETEEAES